MREQAALAGYRPGESAKDLFQRDPEAAKRMADWTEANRAKIIKGISGRLMRSENAERKAN